ncbi:hypothetical protein CDL12_15394 [Handroanthus impetiginosus]|uniref:Uncharacterized protein n=1 Tax=Handroanthus impetiginosus TaxID=429701 RepID=A0A2G9GCP4_9LAMI|nr:hypothetical protein CDL12_24496 [Handroanthus impetiginosus]PIN12005.1 hypothetical protein CDL12_15394 [Handroanthus impetiginosus]
MESLLWLHLIVLDDHTLINVGKQAYQVIKSDASNHSWKHHCPKNNTRRPLKFLIMCLNSIENALQQDGTFTGEGKDHSWPVVWELELWN